MAAPKKGTKKQSTPRKSAAKPKAVTAKKPAATKTRATTKPARKASVKLASPYEMRVQAMVMVFTALSLAFAILAVFKYS